jgi:serine/threonine protein phosphatase PrpC
MGEEQDTTIGGRAGVAGTVVGEYSGMSKKGYAPYNGKKENQDVCFMHQDPATNSMLLATFDGHGQYGHLVSRYFQRHLCESVVQHPSWVDDPAKAMRDCMLAREQELCQGRGVDTSLSGTTAVFALVRSDELTVLNAGDSRLMLGVRDPRTGKVVPREVTIDNKPDDPKEQARIEAAGGRVWAMKYDDGVDGPARVWLANQNIPGLAMSRSLCDEVAKQAGVISEPEVYRVKLGPEVVYLCMATDGLWEFLSNQQVVDMINSVGQDPQAAINILMKKSEQLWRKNEEVVDDTSIILAYMTDL